MEQENPAPTQNSSPLPQTDLMPTEAQIENSGFGIGGFLLVILILLALAGGGYVAYTKFFQENGQTRGSAPTVSGQPQGLPLQPTSQPSPGLNDVSDTQLDKDIQNLDQSVNNLNTDLNNIDKGLNDKAGSLE